MALLGVRQLRLLFSSNAKMYIGIQVMKVQLIL